MNLEIEILNQSSNPLPTYATTESSGLDLRAYIKDSTIQGENAEYDYSNNTIILHSHGRVLIHTGLYINLPSGYEAQIRSRSGLALKSGIVVLNSPATIDSDYTGELGVILYNTSDKDFVIFNGDKIAQLVFTKVEQQVKLKEVTILNKITDRNSQGFGHSGIK